MVDFLTPFQARVHGYLSDPATLDDVLSDGADRAQELAHGTLERLYERSGLLPRRSRARVGA